MTSSSMSLSTKQITQYEDNGFLVLEDFAHEEECDRLRARAEELVQEFDPAEVVSIFSTREQNRLTDEYFMTSGDKIRFFFEENAFNPDGTLKYEKEKSINKIGHALHDLDPVFDRFSRSEKVKELAERSRVGELVAGPIDVHLQAAEHRRRGHVSSGQHVSLHGADRHRWSMVRARRCDD